ncbi:MotA/TolQ/ExbB proton channel family protein [Bacteroidales bacterium OttesenSCG-928-K22]|nr:MotA/TolQ/ExbB proton channel family protein [Bacteroidales bacterium OttesenSCG-928-K22]
MFKLMFLQTLLQVPVSAMDSLDMQMPTEIRTSFWQMFNYGGVIMYLLLLLSIIGIYIFVERLIMVNKAGKDDNNFMGNISDCIRAGRIEEAKTMCKMTNTPLSRMIEKGINSLGKPLQDIKTAIENTGRFEVANLEKNVPFLATISGVAPMIGFLGTVLGMVKAFYNMSMAGNNLDISMLSEGIYQAMITTIGGLIVGIIGYILYNVIVTRIEKVVTLLEAKTTEFMDVLDEPADK